MISCRDLTKRYGSATAVDRLTLEIPAGTICTLLGPNGAGKTTTVEMLTGQIAPSAGEAKVCGIDIRDGGTELKRRIGVLPQDLGLFDDLTVEEHLRLTGDVYGVESGDAKARTDQLLDLLGLADARRVFARNCSHGMRKKTSFAMALLPNPEVLFLDEPFEAIEPVASRVMEGILIGAASRGIAVFLTAHILPIAERVAERVVILRAGRVVWNSLAEEVPHSIERLYFDLAEAPASGELDWLGRRR
jgi:ABC-2 type transport system ATP-binding protein